MRDYGFNDLLVSCDPEREVIFSDKRRRLEVSFAELNGRWAYGYDYTYHIGGSGCAPSFGEYRQSYPTKAEARKAVLRMWEKEIGPTNNEETYQLDLFGGVM